MSKSILIRGGSGAVDAILKTTKGESLTFANVFEDLRLQIPMSRGLIVTTLPRGTLQIAQPHGIPDALFRGYSKDCHSLDRVTWQAIERGRAVRGAQCWEPGQFEMSRYYTEFMVPNGFKYLAAAPLAAPVFEGYPGALHLYRTADQGPFNEHDLESLRETSHALDMAISQTRSSRRVKPVLATELRKQKVERRQFIFDSRIQALPAGANPAVLDEHLRQQMVQYARQRIEHPNGTSLTGDQLALPDSYGDLWLFHVVVHESYPALGDGPFILFSLQPGTSDWSALRPGDFQADSELSRLIPALRFMEQEFARGPSLNEIARTVHLSPFHFHRRFSELLGITPKHFLLSVQIDHAKRQLIESKDDLVDIAKSCGFAHQSHFTSRFKQATGLTPTRWFRFARGLVKSSAN